MNDTQVNSDAGIDARGDASSADAAADSALDSAADSALEGAIDSALDAPIVPPAPMALSFDGPVRAAVHGGDAWYLGGDFLHAEMVYAQRAVGLSLSGEPNACATLEGFDGNVNGITRAGNSIYFVGSFTHYRGQSANRIAKVDATTCALDTTFSPPSANGFDQDVRAIALSVDGSSLFVGGLFESYRGVNSAAAYIAKLNATSGALDSSFNTSAAMSVDGPVMAIAVDGSSVYIGGSFLRYRGLQYAAINLAKLDATSAAIDTTFSPVNFNGFNGQVTALHIAGNSLFVGGDFDAYRQNSLASIRLAKLDKTTGVLDNVFSPSGEDRNGFNARVWAFASDANYVYCVGDFTAYRGVADSANRIAKLDLVTGVLDTTFSPPSLNGFDSQLNAIALASGSLYVGGSFATYRGAPGGRGIAKLDASTGLRDTGFHPSGGNYGGVAAGSSGGSDSVRTVHASGDTIWIGGAFSLYGGKTVNGIARFPDATGHVDMTFSPPAANGFDSSVLALAYSNNTLYAGGYFSDYRGVAGSAHHIAKLNATSGAIDVTFSPPGAQSNGFDATVRALAVHQNALFVGGDFSAYRGVANSARAVAKLDIVSGNIDTVFSPVGATANGFNNRVYAIAATGDALFVGGGMTSYRALGANSANHFARLNTTTGVLDTTFSPAGATANGFDDNVNALLVVGDAVYVGGNFDAYRGAEVHRIAKINTVSGVYDTNFGAVGSSHGFDDPVDSLLSADNALFVGGEFTAYRGAAASASFVARLDPSTGALNTAFTPTGAPSGSNGQVSALASSGTSVLVGGSFSYCIGTQCFAEAIRVNQRTRQPE